MLSLNRTIVLLLALGATTAACRPDTGALDAGITVASDTGSGANIGSDGGGARLDHPPAAHRAASGMCDPSRPSEIPDGGIGATSGHCASDEECDGGQNGRCSQTIKGDWACTYDQCSSDSDCPNSGVCECRDSAMPGSPNTCVPGNCHVDSDCGPGGYCSPALGGCVPNVGPIGYYCHTPDDQCRDASDCNPTDTCMYIPARNRWLCEPPPDCVG